MQPVPDITTTTREERNTKMVLDNDILLAKQGDAQAFGRLYSETVKTAYFVAKRILVGYPEEEIEDVLQDSYVAVYNNLSGYTSGNFQGWVDVIVANRAKNFIKKKKPILFSEMESEDEDAPELQFEDENIEFRPEDNMDYSETKRLVMEIIDSLPEEQRLSVILFYFDELSVKDIAIACECSENTVKSRLNYARKNIKIKVEELEKKGTKLYALPILPFLAWMLKEECKTTVVSASVLNLAGAGTGAVAFGTTGTAAGTASGAFGTASGTALGAAGTSAGSVAGKAGLSLGVKALIGVISAAVIGTAGYGGYKMFGLGNSEEETFESVKDNKDNKDNNDKDITYEADSTETPQSAKFEIKEYTQTLDNSHTFKYVQIENWDNPQSEEINAMLAPNFNVEGVEYIKTVGEVTYNFDNIVSITYTVDIQYDGAIHGYRNYETYNINMITGEMIDGADLFDIEAFCVKMADGDFITSGSLGKTATEILNNILDMNSFYSSGETDPAERIKNIIETQLSDGTAAFGLEGDFVVYYFYVSHADGDYIGVKISDVRN